jgi:hypothetical protein
MSAQSALDTAVLALSQADRDTLNSRSAALKAASTTGVFPPELLTSCAVHRFDTPIRFITPSSVEMGDLLFVNEEEPTGDNVISGDEAVAAGGAPRIPTHGISVFLIASDNEGVQEAAHNFVADEEKFC